MAVTFILDCKKVVQGIFSVFCEGVGASSLMNANTTQCLPRSKLDGTINQKYIGFCIKIEAFVAKARPDVP